MLRRNRVRLYLLASALALSLLMRVYSHLHTKRPLQPSQDIVVFGPGWKPVFTWKSLRDFSVPVSAEPVTETEIWRLNVKTARWKRIFVAPGLAVNTLFYCRAIDSLVACSDIPLYSSSSTPSEVSVLSTDGSRIRTVWTAKPGALCYHFVLHDTAPLLLFKVRPPASSGRLAAGNQSQLMELNLQSGRARRVVLPAGFELDNAIYEPGTSEMLAWSYKSTRTGFRKLFRTSTHQMMTLRPDEGVPLCGLPGTRDWFLFEAHIPHNPGRGSYLWRVHLPDGQRVLEAFIPRDQIEWTISSSGHGVIVSDNGKLKVWNLGRWHDQTSLEPIMPLSVQSCEWSGGRLALLAPSFTEACRPWDVYSCRMPRSRVICVDARTGQYRNYPTPYHLTPWKAIWVPQ